MLRDDRHGSEGTKAIQAGIDHPTTRHLLLRSKHLDLHLRHRILRRLRVLVERRSEQLSNPRHIGSHGLGGSDLGTTLRRTSRRQK